MNPEALTFEEDQPALTADFVDTLNLGPDELVRVNRKQSDGLSARFSELFDWGDATYSLTIRDLGVGSDGGESAYRYEINSVMDAGWRGEGDFSKTKKQLPENYRRLLSE